MLLARQVKETYRAGMEALDCIVPAGGRAERMGEWKPLLPFGGSTIIETVVDAALRVCTRVVLVTGYRGAELAARFAHDPRVELVENPRWPDGMFASVQLGVSRARTRRFFVTLGDMPWIRAETYRALLSADEGSEVVFPVFEGRRGHPVLFLDRVRPAIAAADPAKGSMRRIAESFRVRDLEWADDSVLKDVDTPADLC